MQKKQKYKRHERVKRKNFIFIIIGVILLGIIACVANNYIIVGKNKMTNLVINNRNVTENLKRYIDRKWGNIYFKART